MKPKMPDQLKAGQIWLDEDGDYSIILQVNDDGYDEVSILVISGIKTGEIFLSEAMDKFDYSGNDAVGTDPYFLTCL